jgi:hypothetical protein
MMIASKARTLIDDLPIWQRSNHRGGPAVKRVERGRRGACRYPPAPP